MPRIKFVHGFRRAANARKHCHIGGGDLKGRSTYMVSSQNGFWMDCSDNCSNGKLCFPPRHLWQMPLGSFCDLPRICFSQLLNVRVILPILAKNGQSPVTPRHAIQYCSFVKGHVAPSVIIVVADLAAKWNTASRSFSSFWYFRFGHTAQTK